MTSGKMKWTQHKLRQTGYPLVEWLFVAKQAGKSFGILRDGSWVIETADGLAGLQDNALIFAYPLLNTTKMDIHEGITVATHGITELSVATFPMKEVIIHAIKRGGYWAQRAFEWLPELDLEISEIKMLVSAIESIENNKQGTTQNLRHQARKQRILLTSRLTNMTPE